eukprot:1121017-Prymnesium_polylepis.1
MSRGALTRKTGTQSIVQDDGAASSNTRLIPGGEGFDARCRVPLRDARARRDAHSGEDAVKTELATNRPQ